MEDYNSILKEKKTYDDVSDNTFKKFPWFKVDFVCILLVLVIGYIIYFINVLSPRQIFFDDLEKLQNKYKDIFAPLLLNELESYDNLDGTIVIDSSNYNYSYNKNNGNINLSLNKGNDYLMFSRVGNSKYLRLSSYKDNYLKLDSSNDYINIINNIKSNLRNYLSEDKFIKRYYMNGDTPIVVSELSLNNNDIKSITGITKLDDSYEVLLTIKNHAIWNNIVSLKLTINNRTKNKRSVITYENNVLNYNDGEVNLNFKLDKKNNDFTLKIFKDETLYSVLTGTSKDKSYLYSYKVIDKVYSIDLNVKKEKELITYDINSIIEKNGVRNKSNLLLTINTLPSTIIDSDLKVEDVLEYDSLSDEDKLEYKNVLDTFLANFNSFINNYKQGIYNV